MIVKESSTQALLDMLLSLKAFLSSLLLIKSLHHFLASYTSDLQSDGPASAPAPARSKHRVTADYNRTSRTNARCELSPCVTVSDDKAKKLMFLL